jgi:hypothetical protein
MIVNADAVRYWRRGCLARVLDLILDFAAYLFQPQRPPEMKSPFPRRAPKYGVPPLREFEGGDINVRVENDPKTCGGGRGTHG